MLPSSGYFRNIMCPFFKVGLCCRPHCHYKHIKPEPPERLFPSIVVENEPLLDINTSSEYLELIQSSSKFEGAQDKKPPVVTYIPTPVDKIVKLGGILKDNSKNLEKTSVPEYKPTPIAKLKDLNVDKEYSMQVRKKKKVEEYDPTEVKCASRKRVTFAIETESGEIDHIIPEPDIIITLDSDDNDDSICGELPKFSDDEYDYTPTVAVKVEPDEPSENSSEKLENDKDDSTVEISEFSLVDKIIVDSKKNEQLLKTFKTPVKTIRTEKIFPPSVRRLGGNKKSCDKINKSIPEEQLHLDLNKLKETDSDAKKSIKESTKYDILKSSDIKVDNIQSKFSNKNLSIEKKIKKESTSHDSKKSSSSSSKSSKGKNSDKVNTSKHREETKDKKHSKDSSSNKKSSKDKCDKVTSNKKSITEKIDKKKTEESKIQDGVVSSSSVPSKKSEKSHKTSTDSVVKSENSKTHKKSSGSKHKSSDKSSEPKHKKSKTDSSSDTSMKVKVSSETKHKKTKSTSDTLHIDHPKIKSHTKDKNELCDSDSDCRAAEELLSVSSDSDHDEEECWKIYNESYPNSTESTSFSEPSKDSRSSKKEEIIILGKKRVAHQGTSALKKSKPNAELSEKRRLNPVQVMHNRYAQLQAMYARQNEERANSLNGKPSKSNAQKKIIAMPNSSLIAAATHKNEFSKSISSSKDLLDPPRTPVTTIKGVKRIAHVPIVALKPRPIIPTEFGSRVPTNVRQKYLNAFINEYLKFCSTEDQAFEKALDEEKRAYERSTSKAIYMNVASNAVSRLRHRADEYTQSDASSTDVSSTSSIKPQVKTVSHETILVGPRAGKASFSIERKKQKKVDIDLRGSALYNYLLSYALSPEQLVENGFPLIHPTESGRAVISGYRKLNWCNDAFKRTCSRCAKVYYVNTEGKYVKDEECDFHWGHLWKRRIAGAIESRYSCCQGDSESDGCCVGAGHVFEGCESHALKGYVKTLPKTPPPDKYYGVYALDCEMCYTTAGIELTRVTVIDPELKPVFESFVKPQNDVLDYNTRFSGITEDDLKNVKTSLRDIQAVLLCIFNDRTVLIGHSLESDFKALKLFHKTVVDTSVVFPHKIGLPFKRSLKTLMAEKLNKIIQNSIGGHDSNEDALACMELMIWKIKEDLKRSR